MCIRDSLPTTVLSEHTIYIDPHSGHDSESCLMGGSSACTTLMYAAHELNDSTTIVLANTIHWINETIIINDVENVTLTAMNITTASIVHCSNRSDAGLKFVRNMNLHISGIQFKNCGILSDSTTRIDEASMAKFRTAVYVLNTTNVLIEWTAFVNNRGMGLALFDVNGYVSVLDSSFTGNSVPEEESQVYNGGGGLYIEHTYCTPGLLDCDYQSNPYNNDSVYNISRCNFTNNKGSNPPEQSTVILVYQEKTNSRRLGLGAGITVTLKGGSYGNSINVSNCYFQKNTAGFGAAVDIQLQDYVYENKLNFEHCNFENNKAENGGGGIFIGILFYESAVANGNIIHFINTNFTRNSANFGGGTEYVSSRIQYNASVTNQLTFSHCKWYDNTATLGAAVLLAPEAWTSLSDGQLPVPVFEDCLFKGNQIPRNITTKKAVGALYSSTFTVNFTSHIQFFRNSGTAVSISAGSINILENATVEFRNNTGVRGGALALLEFASLRLFPGSSLKFLGNNATEVGGAIYAAAQDEIEFFFSRSCFIHYVNITKPARDWDTRVEFVNNRAGPISNIEDRISQTNGEFAWGNSFFSVTISPCVRASDTTGNQSITNAFPHDVGGTFTFNESCHDDQPLCGIATAPAMLQINPERLDSKGVLTLFPGEKYNLSLIAKDDLNNTVSAVVTASASPSEVASVDTASLYITDGMVQINGKKNSSFTLTLRTTGRRQVSKSVEAMFIDCPPGFVYQEQKQRCVCSATTEAEQYLGITACSGESFQSLLSKGYWAGCDDDNTLLTAVCPPGYCKYEDNTSNPFYTLPQTCEELVNFICSARRKGRLCGECADSHTVFFHSEQYNCKQCNLGYLGWLFYLSLIHI